MEKVGWDYDNAVVRDRNVFLFADTNHLNVEIQDRLYEAMREKIERNFFNKFFVEVDAGKMSLLNSGFSDYESYRKFLIRNNNFRAFVGIAFTYLNSSENFSGDERKKIEMYGVENPFLRRAAIGLIRKLNRISGGLAFSSLNLERQVEYASVMRELGEVNHLRGIAMAENTVRYMDKFNLKSAGFSFGFGHLDRVKEVFDSEGIGYLLYIPGSLPTDEGEATIYRNLFGI